MLLVGFFEKGADVEYAATEVYVQAFSKTTALV